MQYTFLIKMNANQAMLNKMIRLNKNRISKDALLSHIKA